jgi:CTD small phosphatase-like protein 2
MSNFVNTPRATASSTFRELLIEKKRDQKLPELVKLSSRTPKLQLTITQNFALPDISRMHTPKPRRISPILAHTLEKPLEKQLINLERLIQREEKLSVIHDSLSQDISLGNICTDYWEISNDEALWSVERLLKDSRTKKSMVDSIILESLAISLLIFCSGHINDWSPIVNQLRNMIYFIHQNFLTLVDLVLSRLPLEASPSTWVLTLKTVLKSKKTKSAKRSEHSTCLKQNNEIIANCIRTIIRLMPIKSTPALSMIMHILSNRDKFSIPVARSYVFQQPSMQESSVLPPYLPEIRGKSLTLVLDLDETLVHYSIQGTSGQLLIRPNCEAFLDSVAEVFELVVFTAGLQEVREN